MDKGTNLVFDVVKDMQEVYSRIDDNFSDADKLKMIYCELAIKYEDKVDWLNILKIIIEGINLGTYQFSDFFDVNMITSSKNNIVKLVGKFDDLCVEYDKNIKKNEIVDIEVLNRIINDYVGEMEKSYNDYDKQGDEDYLKMVAKFNEYSISNFVNSQKEKNNSNKENENDSVIGSGNVVEEENDLSDESGNVVEEENDLSDESGNVVEEENDLSDDKNKINGLIDYMIGYLNQNKEQLIAGNEERGRLFDGCLRELRKIKYKFDNGELDVSDCMMMLTENNIGIKNYFGVDLLAAKNGANIYYNEALSLLDYMIKHIETNLELISQNDRDTKDWLREILYDLYATRKDFVVGKINVEACYRTVSITNMLIKDELGYDVLGTRRKRGASVVGRGSRDTSDDIGGDNSLKNNNSSVSIDNINNYNDLLVVVNNYIKLMEEKRIFALRSEDAIDKGRDSQESINKYGNLLKQLKEISNDASTRSESVVNLVEKLNNIANILKNEYEIDLSMLESGARHRVIGVRKGSIRRALGVTASNVLFVAGLKGFSEFSFFYEIVGLTSVTRSFAIQSATFLLIPIINDLLLMCLNKKEQLIITHILKKIVLDVKKKVVNSDRKKVR